ncbi:hypothetical protein [uncultured Roseobacter sp.]|uniref:hypothetical protein n=1 Tax=uncultured Roseobacter sp. TaxID=114847 RepID=UPI0026033D02|nr:hypothetical protein [uncultured Roseobacter sp.]
MSGGVSSGFARAIELLSTVAALIAAFVWFPAANAASKPWVIPHIVDGFGAEYLNWVLPLWQGLLAFLIFAVVRSALGLIFSVVGLSISLRILSLFKKD